VKYTFLCNIVDARPLPEAIENRLRIRYALISAILGEGYLPLRQSVLSRLPYGEVDTSPIVIGRFETFRKREDPNRHVSVIWTPKQSDFKRINKREDFWFLPKEQSRIKETIWNEDVPDHTNKSFEGDFWILHHGNSDDLSNLSVASTTPPPNTSFVRATVPLKSDLKDWTRLQKITTDDILVRSLVSELSRRIPALHDPKKAPRVVVFTESDTTYSRAITGELRKCLEQKNVKLEIYSYLRALDGRLDEPRLPESGENSKSQEPTASLLQQRAISETSFGTSQFDYLRRTALQLKAKRDRHEDVVAVGVLGSYIYDKMLVLEAVRRVLPAAVFFTTDLDAFYLERTKEPFTRHLLVASADDLEANESDDAWTEGRRLPRMRDSYQTVLVKEVRNILRWQDRQPGSSATPTATASPVARIFEIGPGERVDLTDDQPICWPLWWLAQGWFNPLIFVPALVNAFVIFCAVTTRDKKNSPRGAMENWAKPWVYGETILAASAVIALLFILILWNPIVGMLDSLFGFNLRYLDCLLGEPLSLGISIWPSVMIRLLAFAVAIYLLSRAYYSFVVDGGTQIEDLKNSLRGRIQFRFHPKKGGKAVSKSFPSFRRLFGRVRKALSRTIHFRWALFRRRSLRGRIVKLSFAYLLFSFLLFVIWQPTVPGRGGSALLIEKIVLALGVGLYIVHLIFCFDLHFSAFRLLRDIGAYFDPGSPTGPPPSIDLEQMLTSLGTLTTIIGKTLLYPLTVLILIILSRLPIFDNWVMTPSLLITFLFGAIVLVTASLFLWAEGAKLKRDVLAQTSLRPADRSSLQAITSGVFAAWYKQPIFAAMLSALAVFGSVGIALTRLFSEAY
jgi:hypothetical protein